MRYERGLYVQDSAEVLRRLCDAQVEFVVVGDIAAAAHGVRRTGQVLEICASFTPVNMARLLSAIGDIHPCDALSPVCPAIRAEPAELAASRGLAIVTDVGRFDVLKLLPAVGGYDDIVRRALHIEVFGRTVAILELEDLMRSLTAGYRMTDRTMLAELTDIRERLAAEA